MKKSLFPWGRVQGTVALSQTILDAAAKFAKEHYAAAEAIEFSGDEVEDYTIPGWLADSRTWFPEEALRALGFERANQYVERLLATAGVGPHVDAADGPTLAVVLFNNGLKFKQGKESHVTKTGEWLVFNDWLKHEVKEGKRTTSYIVWTVPLAWLGVVALGQHNW